ncbi:MAG: glycine--tRNA ligase subunit beta, partial [Pseudomonadota bacterium]
MSKTATLLIELLTEELPAKHIPALVQAFSSQILGLFSQWSVTVGAHSVFATPRRLALLIEQVPFSLPSKQSRKRGPMITAGDTQGQYAPATLGFARSCGVTVADLQQEA